MRWTCPTSSQEKTQQQAGKTKSINTKRTNTRSTKPTNCTNTICTKPTDLQTTPYLQQNAQNTITRIREGRGRKMYSRLQQYHTSLLVWECYVSCVSWKAQKCLRWIQMSPFNHNFCFCFFLTFLIFFFFSVLRTLMWMTAQMFSCILLKMRSTQTQCSLFFICFRFFM